MELTEDQKKFLTKNAASEPNLNVLTQKCFKDESIDGRSREGRLVRKFLVDNEIQYATSRKKIVKNIEFTKEQKKLIIDQAREGLSSVAIGNIIFPDKDVKSLSAEARAILAYIREVNPDYLPSENGALHDYSPPKAQNRLIKKIYDSTGIFLEENKINRSMQICIDKLAINLSNARFIRIMNSLLNKADRELFEQQFIILTWDKPDLTADELNLYIQVCKDILNLEVISAQMNKINEMFDLSEEQNEMSIRLSEMMKTKSTEYNSCEKRIESLTKKLQGDRETRMKERNAQSATFLSIVQEFQEEKGRENMLKMANYQKQMVEDEADRLEAMAEWKARILGVKKSDIT